MILYTDKFLKAWQGGRQFWFFAIVRPKHRGKQDLVEHEKEHIKQWWLTTLLTSAACGFGAFVANKHLGVAWLDMLPLLALPPSAHGLLYLLLKRYRLWAEVQAYKVSLLYRPDSLDYYAEVLAKEYKLGLTKDQIKAKLRD